MPKPNTKAKMGRPLSYKPEYIQQAEKLCMLGATDIEMADFFGVAPSTFSKWKADHPEFSEALKSGKVLADERVERSLYHKAIGYSFDAVKIMVVKGEIERVSYREHVPPDTTACIFWLKNRRRQQWRDVHKHEHGQPGGFDKMSRDELGEWIRREAAELGISLETLAAVGVGEPPADPSAARSRAPTPPRGMVGRSARPQSP